jgi:ATP-dependent RNA helicase DeaD
MTDTVQETIPSDDAASAFGQFGLDPRILKAVGELGFTEPTPIQARAIPLLLEGRDLIGRARTGSGKTAAFALPLLHMVKSGRTKGGGVRALVLTPTRELALQVTAAIESYARALPLEILTVYGGAPFGRQLDALRAGVPVVVGTPGRLLDHLDRGTLDLSSVELIVLDEADEMLRMGFIDDVERMLAAAPASRQVALFSATMPQPIREIANRHLRNPEEAQVEERALTVDHITQRWVAVPPRFKLDALERVLRGEPHGTTLVFARTRAACAEVTDALQARGFAVEALSGDLDQSARERVVARLRAGRLDLVIATDVAARGIDIDHLTHVINLDLPHDTEMYVHRIGRTGRAGREGMAISFVTPREQRRVRELERALRVNIAQMEVPSDAAVADRKREALKGELERSIEGHGFDAVQQTTNELLEKTGWTPEDLAAAALRLLADARHLTLGALEDDEPPAWSRPPSRARGGERGPRAGDAGVGVVEVLLPIGRGQGLRPADVVGALANELGIPGGRIGRITINDRDSVVGLVPEDAERLLERREALGIRGLPVWPRPLPPNRGGAPQGPPPDQRSGRPGPPPGPPGRGPRPERPRPRQTSPRGPADRPPRRK